MSKCRVRRWTPSDRERVASVLGDPVSWLESRGREQFGARARPGGLADTFVAEVDGQVVGAACLFASRWHPARLWVYVEVAETSRCRGYGGALPAAARELAVGDGRPLKAKVRAGSAGEAFGRRSGFAAIQLCQILELPPPGDAPDGAGVTPVEDDPLRDEAAEAFLSFYRLTHDSWDPVGDIAVRDVLDSHINTADVRLLVRDGKQRPVAIACLYDEDGDWLLSGGPTTLVPAASGAVSALIDRAAQLAADARRTLTVELDDANVVLHEAVQHRRPLLHERVLILATE